MSIAGTGPRIGSARFDALVDKLLTVGAELSIRLGHVDTFPTGIAIATDAEHCEPALQDDH